MSQGVSSIILMVVLIAMIYFMMIRPQRKKDKEDREMRSSLQIGDEIITIGGIVGRITKLTDNTVVITTGAQNTKIEFVKSAIASVTKKEGGRQAEQKNEVKAEADEEKRPDRDKKVTPKKLSRKSETEENQ